MSFNRRRFITSSTAALTTGGILSACSESPSVSSESASPEAVEPDYKISLAQWSLHRALRAEELTNLDFPKFTKETFGIEAVEFVNSFFADPHDTLGIQPKGGDYLKNLKQQCDDNGVKAVLIMCDRVGRLGDPDAEKRSAAVEGHYAWLDAAKFLGCHSIRVNAASDGKLNPEKQADLCADGLKHLSERAAPMGLNVIVENHGGLSSNGSWLAKVLSSVGMDNCGSLPDYGNFYVAKNRGNAEKYANDKAPYEGDPAYIEDSAGLGYNRYKGVEELMPFAKGVSAKAHDFDDNGNEINTDFERMMQIVRDAGYTGYVGIEYEGKNLGEVEGIKATQALLERVFTAA